MFKAYAINLRKSDFELIQRVIGVVTKEPVEIYDLRSYEIETSKEDIVFLFGRRAHYLGKGKRCKHKLELPEVEKLSKDYGTEEDRQETYEVLLGFKSKLENRDTDKKTKVNPDIISEDLITSPDLATDKIRELQYWEGRNKEGRLVRLTREPETGTADINLTFQEFDRLREFMKVFGIKETNIVYKPSANPVRNSGSKS